MSARTIASDEPLSRAEIAQVVDVLNGVDDGRTSRYQNGANVMIDRHGDSCGEVYVTVMFVTRRRAPVAS